MQLMPATAEAVSRDLGLPFSKARLVRDPDYNVRLGSRYLGKQLDRYDDEPALALAAYNAGPSRVSRWLEMHGDPRGRDAYRLIDWIELIPFAETRNYVQRVLEGRGMYRALLAGPKPAPARTAADARPVPRPKPAS
jgi:soluble lytic murein transglycosylase